MEGQNRAKKNWSKLRNIIKSGNLGHKKKENKFNLFDKNVHHLEQQLITEYKYQHLVLFQKSPIPVFKELLHYESTIDATGKWTWQAEEIAAYYFINEGISIVQEHLIKRDAHSIKSKQFKEQYVFDKIQSGNETSQKRFQVQDLKILQLGSGCSGLASICLSQIIINNLPDIPVTLSLTDGQQQNILYLQQNIKLNFTPTQPIKAKGFHLLWGQHPHNNTQSQYDFIIICDCLYFVEYQQDLVHTISKYLSQHGTVFLINPKRGDSMRQFLNLVEKANLYHEQIFFKNEKYETQLKQLIKGTDFNDDKHMQYFTKITKTKS